MKHQPEGIPNTSAFHRSRYDAQKMVGAMIDGEYRFVPPSCTGDPNCLPDCAADPLRCEFDALDVKVDVW